VKKIREENKKNPFYKITVYKQRAIRAGIEYLLEETAAIVLMNMPCTFCNYETEYDKLGGIDRLYVDKGYTSENCVSCCSMCNYMKGCLSPNVYINRCKHITAFAGRIEKFDFHVPIFDPELFANHRLKLNNYDAYSKRAAAKNLTWKITKKEFEIMTTSQCCYLCGKQPEVNVHTNGLDRVDNSEGYDYMNVRTCCGECNYMKKNYELDSFISHCEQVFNFNMDKELIPDYNYNQFVRSVNIKPKQLSKEEKRSIRIKQMQARYTTDAIAAKINKIFVGDEMDDSSDGYSSDISREMDSIVERIIAQDEFQKEQLKLYFGKRIRIL
jgi:hypothetical protein